jgi:hypothetical protein
MVQGRQRLSFDSGARMGDLSAVDVVDGTHSRHRDAIGWFVGDGEKARWFSAVQNDANGTSRHFAAPQN